MDQVVVRCAIQEEWVCPGGGVQRGSPAVCLVKRAPGDFILPFYWNGYRQAFVIADLVFRTTQLSAADEKVGPNVVDEPGGSAIVFV